MKETITVNFILPNEEIVSIEANEGESLLQVAHFHELPLEGACGGSLSCSTCHLIIEEPWFSLLPAALDEEEDMLDLAFGLQKHSRLGCQIILTRKLDGITVKIPNQTNNFCGCCSCS
ncbi:2Fe-2S iron-sulfur cluster-binding protein [Alphaproteobacteria bacterium endosymbiont of Tiliacea citrago]|uniref:2Fe-2S iron-sulfur cluster-binding protein n=1 Tax=Alphaproteobacteria bacterium endosymbiont of Tiliacea citrago TaxID=3077944 RepID=UPI00313B45B6